MLEKSLRDFLDEFFEIRPREIDMKMTPEQQLDLWVAGNSVHNADRDECCPDFSCCGIPIVDKATREQFKQAGEKNRHNMLLSFLVRMLKHKGNKLISGSIILEKVSQK